MKKILSRIMMLVCVSVSLQAKALDVFILDAPLNAIDTRNDYTNQLLTRILQATEKKYGAFRIDYAPQYMQRDRLLAELRKGEIVNVTAKATRPDWESSDLSVIRIPVDKGITEYRIAFIRAEDQEKFNRITQLDELKNLSLGVGHAWSTRQVFEAQKFKFEAAADFEGLYKMLAASYFDYFPRALSEIFVEYEDRKLNYPNIAIEKSFMLYFPLPKYFFVSPQSPRLAQRIEEGFNAMIKDGSFNKIFLQYHQPLIDRADFCSRRIFRLDNPCLSDKTPLNKTEYWYDPFEKRRGVKALCESKAPKK